MSIRGEASRKMTSARGARSSRIVVSVDEKPQIVALDRSGVAAPDARALAAWRTHHGNQAGLN